MSEKIYYVSSFSCHGVTVLVRIENAIPELKILNKMSTFVTFGHECVSGARLCAVHNWCATNCDCESVFRRYRVETRSWG